MCRDAWVRRRARSSSADGRDVDRQVLRVGTEVVVPDPVVDHRVIEDDALCCGREAAAEDRTLVFDSSIFPPSTTERRRAWGVEPQVTDRHFRGPSVFVVVRSLTQLGASNRRTARPDRRASAGESIGAGIGPAGGSLVSVRAVSMRTGTWFCSDAQKPAPRETVDDRSIGDVEQDGVGCATAHAASRASAPFEPAVTRWPSSTRAWASEPRTARSSRR